MPLLAIARSRASKLPASARGFPRAPASRRQARNPQLTTAGRNGFRHARPAAGGTKPAAALAGPRAGIAVRTRRRVACRGPAARADNDGMPAATVALRSGPDRHALVLLDCHCGTCPPTWARRRGKSRRFTEPVTLAAALEREDAAAWPGMVHQHRDSLEKLTAAAD